MNGLSAIWQEALAIFGGVVTIAIISVIISKKSQTPAVLQAASSALANVVAAAVKPINTATTNGNLGQNPFTTPAVTPNAGGNAAGLGITVTP
jgi:hypothetical protein